MLYKFEVHGVGPMGCLYNYMNCETDGEAIREVARVSQAISVSHCVAIYSCVGIVATRKVLERPCGPNEYWA